MNKAWKPEQTRVIANTVRELRKSRSLTQADLATRLGLSQARLSVIEQGRGSFSAEQFLEILKIFNVTTQAFATARRDSQGDLQNALARHGASHLVEDEELLPSEYLQELEALVREVLVDGQNPRQVAALAPVIVKNIKRLNLNVIWAKLCDYGLEARLGWVLENTLVAIRTLLPELPARPAVIPLRQAATAIQHFLEGRDPFPTEPALHAGIINDLSMESIQLDPMDGRVLSAKTLRQTWAKASPVSQRWRIISSLYPGDFAEALRASRIEVSPRKLK